MERMGRMSARSAAVGLAAALALALAPGGALACKFPATFEPWTPSDASPPDDAPDFPSVTLTLGDVVRGRGPQREGCGSASSSSCDDIGIIELEVEGLDPDFAYLFDVEGTLPDGLSLPDEPVQVVALDDLIALRWVDGAMDDQESFDFTLTMTPVDEYGRRGDASEPLVVADHAHGCDASTGPHPATGLAWALVVWMLWRRRRTVA